MPSDDDDWSRRRLLAGVATVGVLGTGFGAGTTAVYSDTQSSVGNMLNAGTLNLALKGGETTVQLLNEADIAPGESGTASMTVANTGVFAGHVDVEVATLSNADNGCNQSEGQVDNTCGDPGTGNGELQSYLETEARFLNGPTLWNRTTLATEPSEGQVYDLDYEIPAGGSDDFILAWWLPDSAGDESQTDSITLELNFRLDQGADVGL